MRALKDVSTKLPADPAEARVAIAKDVIARLDLRAFIVSNGGNYITAHKGVAGVTDINSLEQRCEVCAKGALVLSGLRVFDGELVPEVCAIIGDPASTHDISLDMLQGVFDHQQLNLIEVAFECTTIHWYPDGYERAEEFGSEHDDPYDRLRAIMENIIANNGTFIP